MTPPVVSIRGVHRSFGPVTALDSWTTGATVGCDCPGICTFTFAVSFIPATSLITTGGSAPYYLTRMNRAHSITHRDP